MPRTTTIGCPGCPPLRALTFDELGFIRVIESRSERSVPEQAKRWGVPDPSKCVLAASIDDSKNNPLVAVARKNGEIEVLNHINGDTHASVSNLGNAGVSPGNGDVIGLHLFRRKSLSGACTFLACTITGHATVGSAKSSNRLLNEPGSGVSRTWEVCASGKICCSVVDGSESYALFGGNGVEMNLWDLEKGSRDWTSKRPPINSLGIVIPSWFTSATFLDSDDHRKFVVGTNNHEVRLYDISAQRRPVMLVNFREASIKAVAKDQDGCTIYLGNATGDLASFDIRIGKLLGCFVGKCSGSIRSLARHPQLPVIASCGLDRYLRFWDTKTRKLLSAVFLKQHLTGVAFDPWFSVEVPKDAAEDHEDVIQTEDEFGTVPSKRKEILDMGNNGAQKWKEKSKKFKNRNGSDRNL